MSFRRKEFYIFLVFALFLSSCVPDGAAAAASNGNSDGSILVSGRCIKKDSQIYISREGNYCFAYPFDLYVDNNGEENSITLHTAGVANQSAADLRKEIEGLMGSTEFEILSAEVLLPATLTVFYETHEDYTLDKFVNRRLTEEPIYKLDFHLEEEKAYMLSTDPTGNGESLLHIFTSHKDIYYHIAFTPSFGNVGKNGEKYLMELFIAITETFTFLE